jgi:hypothetical protein
MPDRPASDHPRYWFPAKTYGWGWGLPCAWQGCLVMGGFVGLLTMASFRFPPGQHTPGFVISVLALTAAVVAICWWKGEPPRWRWGGD